MMSRNQEGEERMKAILEFNLDEEREQFDNACNGTKWKCLVWEFDQHLRTQIKYNDKLSEEQHNVYADVSKVLYDMMNEDNLGL